MQMAYSAMASPGIAFECQTSGYLFLNDSPLSLLLHFLVIFFHPFRLSLSSILYLGQCPRLFNSDRPLAMPSNKALARVCVQ
jgi:hypothetical protein